MARSNEQLNQGRARGRRIATVVLVIALAVLSLASSAFAGPRFKSIRIGDADGFGYGGLPGLIDRNGDPVDPNHNGLLEGPAFDPNGDGDHSPTENRPVEFAPDLDRDGHYGGGSDEFDHRAAAERSSRLVSGTGFTDVASAGSDWTDFGISTAFPGSNSDFPDGNRALPNNPQLVFDFAIADAAVEGRVYFRLLWADAGVEAQTLRFTFRSGATQSVTLASVPGSEGGGLIWASAELPPSEIFSPAPGGGLAGYLKVDVLVPTEGFFAVDYAEIAVIEPSVCGDGVVGGSECCDLGSGNGPGSGCSKACDCMGRCTGAQTECATAAQCPPAQGCCGNTILESGEQCDDGNVLPHDCCSPTCQNEASATCAPSLCTELGIYGPHVVPATEKLQLKDAKLDGTMELWTKSGEFILFSGRNVNPGTERVVVSIGENDGTNRRGELHRATLTPTDCAPASTCFVSNKAVTSWRYRDSRRFPDAPDACGLDMATIRESSGNKIKFQIKGKSDASDACAYDFPRPSGTVLREDIVIGDDCATVVLDCGVFGGNRTYRCVP